MREEYSERKLFLGMALRPQNKPRPSSATRAMTWLLRSMAQSLSASEARSAWPAGIAREPGSLAPWANASLSSRTRSGMKRKSPPSRVVNSRGLSAKRRTSATASALGPTRLGRSSSRRRGKGANPSAASTSRTAVLLERHALLLERLADFVDGIVALAQRHDLFLSAAFVGLGAW